ncbi:MAG: hypothetical protein AAFP02_22775, partial [Bacteroidota bacterium]
EAQLTPAYALSLVDVDGDVIEDLIIGGNFYAAKPEVGIHDASYGLVLSGQGDGSFQPMSMQESGLFVKGEIRDLLWLDNGDKRQLWVARNNDYLRVFEK